MAYDESMLRQIRGQQLINNMNTALKIFRQEDRYQQDVQDQLRYLENLKNKKKIWSLTTAMRHPSTWMLPAIGITAAIVLLGFFWKKETGIFMWLSILLFPLSLVCLPFNISFLISELQKVLKKLLHRSIQWGTSGIVLMCFVVLTIVLGGLRGFSLVVVVFELLAAYTALAWLDQKFVSAAKAAEKTASHFKKKDEAAALELSYCCNTLAIFQKSDQMAFAHAAVPPAFWNSKNLSELLDLMENRGLYSLSEGTNAYYIQKGIDAQIALEQERLREAQYQTEQQRAQTAILERQRKDNEWHNKEMRYQQQRENDRLNDIHREQKEHNRKIERNLFY